MLVKVPYNLRVDDEVRIYEKLLKESGVRGVHIAPHTLRAASIFAILTRLEPSKKSGMSLVKKLKLYNGESVEGFTSKDVKELQEEAVREGMIGISPAFVGNVHLSGTVLFSWLNCSQGPRDNHRPSAGNQKHPASAGVYPDQGGCLCNTKRGRLHPEVPTPRCAGPAASAGGRRRRAWPRSLRTLRSPLTAGR